MVPSAAGGQVLERDPPGPVVPGNLPFFHNLHTFRGEGGNTAVVGSFAIPAGRLEAREDGGQVRYRFDVSLVLADTARGHVFRTDDSVFVAATREVSDEHLLFTYVEVEAPPVATVRRVVMTDANTPGVGQLYHAPFRVPDYRGSHLMLSDIALGQPGAVSGWRRGEVTLALFPTGHFPASSFAVYYEVYNLPDGAPYTTELRVEPLDVGGRAVGDPDRAMVLRFAGEAEAGRTGVVQELRHVSGSLDPGRYRLTVLVTEQEGGATASTSRAFHVRGRDPGATMVTALPRGGSDRP